MIEAQSFELELLMGGDQKNCRYFRTNRSRALSDETINVVNPDSVTEKKQMRVDSAITHENLMFGTSRAVS